VNKQEEGLSQFNLPPIFDNYGDEEILGLEDYSEEKLLEFEELERALIPLSSCKKKNKFIRKNFTSFCTRLHVFIKKIN